MAAMAGLQVCMVAGVRSGGAGMVKFAGPRRIRCQAEDKTAVDGKSTPAQAMPSPPTPPSAPKVSTKIGDVLAFSGSAPERINGRLAMVGFVSAVAVELSSGNDLVTQLSIGGLPWFLWVSGVLSAASLVPLFKGVTVESVSGGVMSADAEMWNGRLAMLGLVAMALTEYLKGGPLV